MQGGPAVTTRELKTDEQQWLELTLYELATVVRAEGKEAVLYCSGCRREIAYSRVVPGPIREWPYCPVHAETPLIMRSGPINPCSNPWASARQGAASSR
jgi:hypothetical protein